MKHWIICLLLVVATNLTFGARILAVLPFPARSHHYLFDAILKALAERGHQVTSYTPYPRAKPIDNYTEIHLNNVQNMHKTMTKEQLDLFMNQSPVRTTSFFWEQSKDMVQVESDELTELIKSNEMFDLIVLEPSFGQEILLGLGHKFNAPVISVLPIGSFSLSSKASGNPLSLAFIPDFCFPYSDNMSFYERFISTYSILTTLIEYYTQYLPSQDKLMKELFDDPTMPSLVEMIHNISLFVNNAHPYVHYSLPRTPNLISVGGIHLSQEQKPLPLVIKKFLDEAEHGVIYFSLGSLVPEHQLPPQFFDNFMNVFRRLPQRVLWKISSELSMLPENVMTLKWAPQQDILAHPNVVLFMTHGGIFSQHEAIMNGVPVICIPFLGDQNFNARFYEERGIGVKLPFKTISEGTIYSALITVLNNPKYKQNMARLSAIYRDRPISVANSLVFWVEYVLRHRGAPHLRPASATMTWYQLALLDVLAALAAALLTVTVVLFLIIKKISCIILRKKDISKTSSYKKQN